MTPSEAAQKAAGAVLHGQGFRRIFGGRRKILEEEKHLAILQTRHLVPERAPKLAFSGAAASEVERMQSGASLTHRNYVQIHILNNFCIESYL